jgi:predicted RNA-binding protein Jag
VYDSKQEPHEFVAENREAAVEKARSFFGLQTDQLLVCELPLGEVYGLGGRTVVVAMPRDRKPPQRTDRDGGRDRDRGDRGRESRGGRDRDRDRDRGRGGRDRDRGGRDRGGFESRDRDRDRDRAPQRELAAPPVSDEPSVGSVEGSLGEIGEFVKGALERLELGPFSIRESQDGANTVVEVKGAAAEALAGGEARGVDALQLLANQVLLRRDEEATGRVVLDVEGGSDSRERHLERLAERVVKRAIEGGRAIALDPMNGRDRRTIHISVREYEGVATMSIGEGRFRQVVVVPEGAPEYEEAQRQSQGSAE